jgi:hypothetical protein
MTPCTLEEAYQKTFDYLLTLESKKKKKESKKKEKAKEKKEKEKRSEKPKREKPEVRQVKEVKEVPAKEESKEVIVEQKIQPSSVISMPLHVSAYSQKIKTRSGYVYISKKRLSKGKIELANAEGKEKKIVARSSLTLPAKPKKKQAGPTIVRLPSPLSKMSGSLPMFSPFQSLNHPDEVEHRNVSVSSPHQSQPNRVIVAPPTIPISNNKTKFKDLISLGHWFGFFSGDQEMLELQSFANTFSEDMTFCSFMELLQTCVKHSRRDKGKTYWQTNSPPYWAGFRERIRRLQHGTAKMYCNEKI